MYGFASAILYVNGNPLKIKRLGAEAVRERRDIMCSSSVFFTSLGDFCNFLERKIIALQWSVGLLT